MAASVAAALEQAEATQRLMSIAGTDHPEEFAKARAVAVATRISTNEARLRRPPTHGTHNERSRFALRTREG
jgi:hypothetical protein